MIVRNCVAHDGKRTPIQLVNEMGCVIRPKIMSKFNKIKNFGSSASVVSYAYFQVYLAILHWQNTCLCIIHDLLKYVWHTSIHTFEILQAFKFPDSMNVHFQCVIQVCRFNCPDPVCPDNQIESHPSVTVGASVTSYAGPSLTTARSFVVPSSQAGGQVSQALPPLLQHGPPFSGLAQPPQGININRHRGNIGGGGARRRHIHPQGPNNPPGVVPRTPFTLHQQKQHQTR